MIGESPEAKRAKYVAKVRKAYRDGELTDAQADALRAAGVNLDRFQPLMAGVNDLATLNPEIAAQWHPEKNGDLAPADVTAGSNRKVWWRHWCDKTQSWHEWEAVVAERTGRGTKCPYCSNQKVLPGFNDLSTTHPELAIQWHPTKNGALTPADVTAGSNRKVWWRHKAADGSWHEWAANINKISKSDVPCPYCGNRRILPGFNDLSTTHPELAIQWHPTKNGALTPADVTAGGKRKVWWRCEKGHEWQAAPSARSRKGRDSTCPYCSNKAVLPGYNDLATTRPDLAAQWHPTKNGALTPADVTAGSNRKVWWRHWCDKTQSWHEWEQIPGNRSRKGQGCPYCSNQKVLPGYNDLATTRPDLAAQWHPTKNGALTPADVTAGSNRKVWWRHWCDKTQSWHEWEAKVRDASAAKLSCPYCGNRKILAGFNDLGSLFPEPSEFWHPTKNGALTPADVMAGSGRKVWWKCPRCGKQWISPVREQAHRKGCSECAARRVGQTQEAAMKAHRAHSDAASPKKC